jgi:acyl carrier protein
MITLEELSRRIREQRRGKLADDMAIEESTALDELGLSSLEVSEIVFGLEEEHGVEFDASKAADVKTVGELIALANASLDGAQVEGAPATADARR